MQVYLIIKKSDMPRCIFDSEPPKQLSLIFINTKIFHRYHIFEGEEIKLNEWNVIKLFLDRGIITVKFFVTLLWSQPLRIWDKPQKWKWEKHKLVHRYHRFEGEGIELSEWNFRMRFENSAPLLGGIFVTFRWLQSYKIWQKPLKFFTVTFFTVTF